MLFSYRICSRMAEQETLRLSLVERPEDKTRTFSSSSSSSRSTWIHMSSFSRASGYHASGLRTSRQ